MAGQMFFGTADRMTWVQCPAVNMGANSVRWIATSKFVNGGASQRQSATSHMEYSVAWNPTSYENLSPIMSYFNGTYGDGPLYFLDPGVMKQNVLPVWYAAPFLQALSGPSLSVLGTGYPSVTATEANTLGYPTRSAQFSVTTTGNELVPVRIPVPVGYTLHVGAHGLGPTVRISVGGTLGTLLSVHTTQRTNVEVVGTGGLVDLKFIGTVASSAQIAGVIAQVLPTGQSVAPGGFLPGMGHSGVRLAGDPQVTEYSAALEHVSYGMTADLIETGIWE